MTTSSDSYANTHFSSWKTCRCTPSSVTGLMRVCSSCTYGSSTTRPPEYSPTTLILAISCQSRKWGEAPCSLPHPFAHDFLVLQRVSLQTARTWITRCRLALHETTDGDRYLFRSNVNLMTSRPSSQAPPFAHLLRSHEGVVCVARPNPFVTQDDNSCGRCAISCPPFGRTAPSR